MTDEVPLAHQDEHHRDVSGGGARAAVFGISDGLVSNVGLILGVAGADTDPSVVRLAGLAGLLAGAISMAAGEYNSVRVQNELFERELALERRELERNPRFEAKELADRYTARGVPASVATELADSVMSDVDLALDFHAREELGVAPGEMGSPFTAAGSSLVAFSVGAVMPLVPWFFLSGTTAVVVSLVVALVTATIVGVVLARFTEIALWRSVGRQLTFTAVPAALTYALGSAIGVGVG